MKSLRELFRIGKGPSSSHTMGPAKAASLFKNKYGFEGARYEVELLGSLAATGRGHMTDTAILAELGIGTTVTWSENKSLPFHPNAMIVSAYLGDEKKAEETYYSVGGGAVSVDGAGEDAPELYKFRSTEEILDYCDLTGVSLWQVVEEAEGAEIWEYLEEIWKTMLSTLEKGLVAEGSLPGLLKLPRQARSIYQKTKHLSKEMRRTGLLVAYARAVSEENAALGTIVTAPTCGAAGTLPAVLRYLKETLKCSKKDILHALAIAGLFGNVVKTNGSISGAEVGCQGEVGVACAMASAAASYLMGGSPRQCETAAEIGLEHFLGLTCDPVAGLVQVPCIERNAIAACRALVAGEMSVLSDGSHIVSFDTVIKTMVETGRDLPSLYRETSMGGLSLHVGK